MCIYWEGGVEEQQNFLFQDELTLEEETGQVFLMECSALGIRDMGDEVKEQKQDGSTGIVGLQLKGCCKVDG